MPLFVFVSIVMLKLIEILETVEHHTVAVGNCLKLRLSKHFSGTDHLRNG